MGGPSVSGESEVTCREEDSGAETLARKAIEAKVRSRIFAPKAMVLRIGRFTVLEELGRGGMGMVYAAYDEELDRKVAIKVLRDEELPSKDSRLRFQREAQTQARLSHPHVVTVHEVGEADDGQMFLAMEFVRGESLDVWLRGERTWTEILEVYLQAGRGLLAAHHAGLVHRDFKPQNVIRGDDGVVKVLDFGLARALEDSPNGSTLDPDFDLESVDRSGRVHSGSYLTVPGEVMGTPRYMSPEQHDGSAADARSDQYGFCVALWLALTGTVPFEGKTIGELFQAKLQGAPSWPADAAPVPRRMVEALRRGLAVQPQLRWPSMAPLLEALTHDPTRRRQRWLWGLLGVTALATGGLMTRVLSADSERCSGAQRQLDGVWDDARRAEVKAAILGLDASYVGGVWENTSSQLDAYASEWVAVHTDACEATAVRAEQSPQMLDRRMRCLDRAVADLRASVDTLADANADVVSNAHELVAGLRPLSSCSDTEALAAEVEPPRPEEAESVEETRLALSRARARRRAGRYAEARIELDRAKERLATVEYSPVRVEVTLEDGRLLVVMGDYEAAESALSDAMALASTLRLTDSMREATRYSMVVLGRLWRSDDALLFRPLLLGLSRGRILDDARAHDTIARALHGSGRYDEAEVSYRRAEDLFTEALGAEHHDTVGARSGRAGVLADRGKYAAAEAEFRAAMAQMEQSLGSEHPEVATFHENIGLALSSQEKFEQAEAELRSAMAIRVEALGPEHDRVLGTRVNLANLFEDQGKYDEAEAEFRTLIEATDDDPSHAYLNAAARTNLGNLMVNDGRVEEAVAELQTALALLAPKLGPRHPQVLVVRINLDNALQRVGRNDEAEADVRALIPLLAEVMGPEHPNTTVARTILAAVLESKGQAAEALPLREEIVAVHREDGAGLNDRVKSLHYLARALWDVEGPLQDRARARTLRDEAYRLVRETEDVAQSVRDPLEAWLDARPLE